MQTVNYHRVLKAGMWLAVVVGAYSRLRGLGTWPLAEDEYYIAQSVNNIIQHGVPAFGCGGYYMRGLTLQYLVAPLRVIGFDAEFAVRLVTMACSFLALPAVYILGKRLSGVTVACVSVALLSLSLWEIEFARFGRMYVPFQMVFLWYLVALHRVVVDRRRSAYGWLWLLSVIGSLTWAGGLFLLVINFVPSLFERVPSRIRYIAVSAGLLVLGYLYNSVPFRFIGSLPSFPSDVPASSDGSGFIAPPVLASTLPSHPVWLVCGLILLGLCVIALVKLARISTTIYECIAWSALIVLSLLNLFGCVLIGLVLSLLFGWVDPRRASRRSTLTAVVPIAVSFCFWLAYAQFTTDWHRLFPGFGPGGELSKLVVVLVKYPNIFNSILFPWLDAVPVLTAVFGALIALACAWAIWAVRAGEWRYSESLRLMLATFLLLVVLVGVVETNYSKTRYTFFLLPVFYLIAVTVIYELLVRPLRSRPTRAIALGLALLALVGLVEDFGWAHLVHMSRVNWNYRLPLRPLVTGHYYPRYDYLTPAEFVNLRARPTDRILITELPVAYYLKNTDYVYRNFREREFASVTCDFGRRERWTDSRLLYTRQQLFNTIASAPGAFWLIVKLPQRQQIIDPLEQRFSIETVYLGMEGQIAVFKINRSH